jgi:hypothetical protein
VQYSRPTVGAGPVETTGFVTTEQLAPEEALGREFKPMPPGTRWGAKWEYGWFRGEVVLPGEAEGERVVVRPDVETFIAAARASDGTLVVYAPRDGPDLRAAPSAPRDGPDLRAAPSAPPDGPDLRADRPFAKILAPTASTTTRTAPAPTAAAILADAPTGPTGRAVRTRPAGRAPSGSASGSARGTGPPLTGSGSGSASGSTVSPPPFDELTTAAS